MTTITKTNFFEYQVYRYKFTIKPNQTKEN
jgi:hypothetical protein